jgi:hypothetical protein
VSKPNPPNRAIRLRYTWRALALLVLLVHDARAQSSPPDPSPPASASELARFERTLQSVVDENRRLAEEVRQLKERSNAAAPEAQPPSSAPPPPPQELPTIADFQPLPEEQPPTEPFPSATFPSAPLPEPTLDKPFSGRFKVDYDKGFVILPTNPKESPFSLKVNNQATFRYSGFARNETSWTDSAGNVLPIVDSSNFLIPRGRLIFTGNALTPDLSYLLNIDYNTAGRNQIGFRAYSLSYRWSRALELSVGQNKVPGTREWIYSSWFAQEGPDRTMATTFFRPSLSQGIWLKGEPLDRLYYHAMLSNGFNTLNITPGQFNHRVCFSESVWWEPLGDFGPGYSDIEAHRQLAIRAGSSFTYALAQGSQTDSDAAENSSLRLSDGTVITQPGAFAPGVTLQAYDVALAAFDLAFKYRGLALSTELYFQELRSLQANGPLPFGSTSATGGFVQGGFFLLPGKIELYSRTSWVTGRYGSGTEIAGGFNWFILPGKTNLRFTFDVADLESSPADQNRTGFIAGQSGLLLRTQINASF